MANMKLLLLINLILVHDTITQFSQEAILKGDENIYEKAIEKPYTKYTGTTVPGTKWCGPGHTAKDYNDLGSSRRTDLCCRDHDHCEEILEPGKKLHDLQNPDWFPRLKCSCEQKFIQCLQKVNDMLSTALISVYFNSRYYCFDVGYPILSCTKYEGNMLLKRCKAYKVNQLSSKKWQFYDIALYM